MRRIQEVSGRRMLGGAVLATVSIIAGFAAWGILALSLEFPLNCAAVVGLAAVLWLAFDRVLLRIDRLSRRAFLFSLVFSAALPRLAWYAGVRNQQVTDYAIYHELSSALATGVGYATTGPVGVEDMYFYIGSKYPLPYATAYRPPGTAFWGSVLYRLFGIDADWFKLSNVILGIGTCLLIYRLLKAFGNETWARGGALLWALYPESIFATNLVCSEVLFTFFLVLLAALLALDGAKRIPLGRPFIEGLLAAWCSLLRPMTAVIIAAASLTWLLQTGWKEAGRRSASLCLGLGLGLAPWAYRNWRVMHAWIPISTTEGITLAEKSLPGVPDAVKNGAPWKQKWEDWLAQPGEALRYRGSYAMTIENMKQTVLGGPANILRYVAANGVRSFGDDIEMLQWSVRNSFKFADRPGPKLALSDAWVDRWGVLDRAFYLMVALAAAVGAFRRDAFAGGLGFLTFYFLAMFMLLASFQGEPRYHFTSMVVLCALAAGARLPSRSP